MSMSKNIYFFDAFKYKQGFRVIIFDVFSDIQRLKCLFKNTKGLRMFIHDAVRNIQGEEEKNNYF